MRIDTHSWTLATLDLSHIDKSKFGLEPFNTRLSFWKHNSQHNSTFHSYRFNQDFIKELIAAGAVSYTDVFPCCNYHCLPLVKSGVRKSWGELYTCPYHGCTVAWWGGRSLPGTAIVRKTRADLMNILREVNIGNSILKSVAYSIGSLNRFEAVYYKLMASTLAGSIRERGLVSREFSAYEKEIVRLWESGVFVFGENEFIRTPSASDSDADWAKVVKAGVSLGLDEFVSAHASHCWQNTSHSTAQRVCMSINGGRLIDLE